MDRVLEDQQSLLKCKRNKQSSVNPFFDRIIDLVHCDCCVALLVECMMDDLYCGVAVDWPPYLRIRDYGIVHGQQQRWNGLTTVRSGMLSVLSSGLTE